MASWIDEVLRGRPARSQRYAEGPSEEEGRQALAGRGGLGDPGYWEDLNRLAYEQPTDVQRSRAVAAERLIAGLDAPQAADLERQNNAGVEQRFLDRARSQASEIARRGFSGGYAQSAQVQTRQGRDTRMEEGRQKALYDAASTRNKMRAKGSSDISDVEEEIQRRRMLGFGVSELDRRRAHQDTMDKWNFVLGGVEAGAEGVGEGLGWTKGKGAGKGAEKGAEKGAGK